MDVYICNSDTYLALSKGESEYGLLNSVAKELIIFSTTVLIDGKLYSRHSKVADFEVDPFIDVNNGVLDIKLDGVYTRIESTGEYGVFIVKEWKCSESLASILCLEPRERLTVSDIVVSQMNNYKGKALDELLDGFQQYRLKGETDWEFRKRTYFTLRHSEKMSMMVCLILGANDDCFMLSDWTFWTKYSELDYQAKAVFVNNIKIDPVRRRIFNGY